MLLLATSVLLGLVRNTTLWTRRDGGRSTVGLAAVVYLPLLAHIWYMNAVKFDYGAPPTHFTGLLESPLLLRCARRRSAELWGGGAGRWEMGAIFALQLCFPVNAPPACPLVRVEHEGGSCHGRVERNCVADVGHSKLAAVQPQGNRGWGTVCMLQAGTAVVVEEAICPPNCVRCAALAMHCTALHRGVIRVIG